MKKLSFFAFSMLAVLLLSSCGASKNVAYIQNSDSISYEKSRFLYDARIMPKDQLTISVNTVDPEVSLPYNLLLQNAYSQGKTVSAGGGSGTLMPYLVDNDGYINFPIVGRIYVQGLTKRECEALIEEKIAPYLAKTERPVVTVRMSSFRITLLGDFSSPKVVPVTTEKMSVLEALASGGDLTLYGKRQNVMLIREDATGKKSVHRIDLTDANFINSPYYYVQQNDIIYVEPNATKAKNSALGQSTSIWFSFISISTSVASLLVNILRD